MSVGITFLSLDFKMFFGYDIFRNGVIEFLVYKY